ncbi:FeoA family protein [Desulfocurvus sp.]|jgi:ferrous iron transport protein A|uniref:FeoA family protein n=1 Tax=Desulfocurvus sp. TaxID=2871698 RepID=UPI0025B97C1A|nr:FeoA family protein [Desulfocurvus sp.]MCK9241356.1 ferrous iron transport protein A [Desulfocurvus sp.]
MTGPRTLKTVHTGEKAFIVGIDAGSRVLARLESLGLLPGVEVDVLANGSGPMLVSVGQGRVVVEAGIASKVLVA